MENALSKSEKFKIQKGKEDLKNDREDEVIIDVMECGIERPKKSKRIIIRGRRDITPLKWSWSSVDERRKY